MNILQLSDQVQIVVSSTFAGLVLLIILLSIASNDRGGYQ